jgi:predicted metal-dependent hydrolase
LARSKTVLIEVDGLKVPLKIYAEARRNGRVSLGKRTAILRYPDSVFARGEAYYVDWATAWLEEQYRAKPEAFQRFTGSNIKDQITIMGESWSILIEQVPAAKGSLRIGNDQRLKVSIPDDLHDHDQVEMRRRLLSRFAARRYRTRLVRKVEDINRRLFDTLPINAVRLKYNRSNWGSCSTKGNVNLSTRLLLTPEPAMDYVIIHELCHLLEMNHGPRFYAEVAKRMPDYRQQEKWLAANYVDF